MGLRILGPALALAFSAPVSAALYSGVFIGTPFGGTATGNVTAQYNIETDGTLGVLTTFNIRNFQLSVQDDDSLVFGPVSVSSIMVLGSILTADINQLNFNTSGSGAVMFQDSLANFVCLAGAAFNHACNGESRGTYLFGNLAQGLIGNGRVHEPLFLGGEPNPFPVNPLPEEPGPGGPNQPPPAVPEPAAWAMLIAGFGLVGASARRRRIVAA